ncbi:MAG: hypothetical protein KGJ86_17195 [Chloroflexota bacterium]|nr:hypothetical protein [Chloroflexota bacterium]
MDENLTGLRLYEAGWQFPPSDTPYSVGQIWDLAYTPRPKPVPPHVEDVAVAKRKYLRKQTDLASRLRPRVQLWQGNPTVLFDGMLHFTGQMHGYVERPNVPDRSTGFWLPADNLQLVSVEGKPYYRCVEGKLCYRHWVCDLKYVGVTKPVDTLSGGTLVRVSLARWWRPSDAPDDLPERCYLQLSGWYL